MPKREHALSGDHGRQISAKALAAEVDSERPVLIAGPTASGKSALALAIAAQSGGVIVNADALQIHASFRVLTARPSEADEARTPHALFGHVAAHERYSVGAWLADVAALPRRPRWIVTGGTGLYLTALTEGLTEAPPTDAALRARSEAVLERSGLAGLLADLDASDPETAQSIDRANPRRVQRAWEVLMATGQGLSAWHRAMPPPLLPLRDAQAFVLDAPREWLAARAKERFDTMIEEGALDEVAALLPQWEHAKGAAQAIGAPELVKYLRGEITLEAATDLAVISTRRYIKRQQNWFRSKMHSWARIDARRLGAS